MLREAPVDDVAGWPLPNRSIASTAPATACELTRGREAEDTRAHDDDVVCRALRGSHRRHRTQETLDKCR